ncbi:MAG: hypothetical protein ACHP7A_05495 [Caulobacterales bacterium]|jgi:hypothetical protein
MIRAAALASVLAIAAQAAHAEPVFDAFTSICVKNAADGAASLAAADAAGWMPIPAPMMQNFSKLGFDNPDGRIKTDAAGLYIVLVGSSSRPIEGLSVSMRVCAVATTAAAAGAALNDEMAAWAAVPSEPRLSHGSQVAYAFTEEGGVHRVLQDPTGAEAKALLASGRANFAFVRSDPKMAMVAFAVPKM